MYKAKQSNNLTQHTITLTPRLEGIVLNYKTAAKLTFTEAVNTMLAWGIASHSFDPETPITEEQNKTVEFLLGKSDLKSRESWTTCTKM
jgi:hypothetical protein